MIVRVVKMTFRDEGIEQFLQLFLPRSEKIRYFPGCSHLQLWRDTRHHNVYFSYSWWESEEALNTYRESELFKETWALAKAQFGDKPEAWSVEKILELP